MREPADTSTDGDHHDLARFVSAQRETFERALAELRAGRKTSHWMWFIFPQIAGLGHSPMAQRYAIRSDDEARAFLAHPLLGSRLRTAAAALLDHRDRGAEAIMGGIDAVKLRSSMTLFAQVADDPAPFRAVLDAFYDGAGDPQTLKAFQPAAGTGVPPAGPTGAGSPRE